MSIHKHVLCIVCLFFSLALPTHSAEQIQDATITQTTSDYVYWEAEWFDRTTGNDLFALTFNNSASNNLTALAPPRDDASQNLIVYKFLFDDPGDYYLYVNRTNSGGGNDSLFVPPSFDVDATGIDAENRWNELVDNSWTELGIASDFNGSNPPLAADAAAYFETGEFTYRVTADNVANADLLELRLKGRESIEMDRLVLHQQSGLSPAQLDALSFSSVDITNPLPIPLPPEDIIGPPGGIGNIFLPTNGQFVIEAESYSAKTIGETNAHEWIELDGISGEILEGPDTGMLPPGPTPLNARGNVMKQLPDVPGGTAGNINDSLTLGPNLDFTVRVTEPGEYQLYLRWDGYDGNSDSMHAAVVELADGPGNAADSYRFSHGGGALDFSTAPWQGVGEFEGNSAGGNDVPAVWTIAAPGDYTIRTMIREDGATLDSLIFQESSLPAPTATGPLPTGTVPVEPFDINGSGETYAENFDGMSFNARAVLPKGWSAEDDNGSNRRTDSLGLTDGPLDSPSFSVAGIANVGGNPERFSTPADGRLGTWKDDLDGSGLFDEPDAIADAAADRALGNARVLDDETGILSFEIEISDKPLRAFVADWDLEVWGGDPETGFRGSEGAGYATDLTVGDVSYYSETVSLIPGDLFDSSFDFSPDNENDPTLINGNEHAVRGNTSGIVEVTSADGAVGNLIQWTFNADFGGSDGGWIPAVDNVQLRALAAGDAQADGDVDPADLIQLLAGGAFGQGNIDATWGQGDFDNDGDFDGTDILAVVQGLAGEFPKTYSHDPNNGVPDVLINPATGNITLDTNGTTIGSIVMDSAAGIFNGPNSPSWDAPGDFAADIDTQISMPISFTNPGYSGVDDLGDGIIGDLAPGFDILADLTIKYLDPNGDLLDAEAHVVPEPSSCLLFCIGALALLAAIRRRGHF